MKMALNYVTEECFVVDETLDINGFTHDFEVDEENNTSYLYYNTNMTEDAAKKILCYRTEEYFYKKMDIIKKYIKNVVHFNTGKTVVEIF